MREKIASELKSALDAGERCKINMLRLVTAAIKDRDVSARAAGRDRIADIEIERLLCVMVKQREQSAKDYENAARLEMAEDEKREIEVLQCFLPEQLCHEDVNKACKNAINDVDAAGLRDVGKVMDTLKERYPGQMDFGKASCVVKEMLG